MVKKSMKKSMKKMKGGDGQCGLMKGGKRRGSRKSRRTLKGGMYGVDGVIAPGALAYGAAYAGAADPKTGAPVEDPALKGTPSEGSFTGLGGRRRKSRKGSKKSRKGTRKMRGGATPGMVSMGPVGYGFTDGSLKTSGPTNVTQYTQPGNPY
jgi:hypothetical protein